MGKIRLWDGLWIPYWSVEDWGGQDSELTDTLNLMEMPITFVRLTYDDLLTKYDTLEHILAVKKCQKDHIAEGLEDIRYNFLVNSEGHVYEGRGWFTESRGMPDKYSDLTFKLLTIVYMGDYSTRETMGRFDVDEKLFLPVVDRGWWGELTPDKDDMVIPEHPFVYVRFAWDDVDRGDNPDLVGALMKWEERMMNVQKLPDVPYNFMIGSEGIVYEGRGWHMDADRPLELVTLTSRSLDIAYIGDYSKQDPPWEMIYTAHNLILYGLKEKFIWEEFRVIPYSREKTKKFV